MKIYAFKLYRSMLKELQHYRDKRLPREEEIESCFQIASNYWQLLEQKLRHYEFDSEREEIYFFKKIKPLFIAEIKYYNLLYHSKLFMPMNQETEMEFWKRESQRLQKFIRQHREFYKYWVDDLTSMDETFFLRVNNHLPANKDIKVFDVKLRTSTSHDHLVGSLKALRRYTRYVKSNIERLTRVN